MKTVIKNVVNKSKVLVAALVLVVTANAQADGSNPLVAQCYVRVNNACPVARYIQANVDFKDDPTTKSNIDATRCLERAQEYKDWCNLNGKITRLEVVSYYTVNGFIVTGASTNPDGHSYVFHGGANNYNGSGFSK